MKELDDNKVAQAKVIAKMEAEYQEQKSHIANQRELIENLTKETKRLTKEKESVTNQSIQTLVLDTLAKMWSTSNPESLKTNLDEQVSVMMADLAKQKETIKKSADQQKKQISDSNFQKGLEYYNKRDMRNAFQYLKAAADANHEEASYYIGEMFLSPPGGEVIIRSEEKALEYFKRCPNHKNAAVKIKELSAKLTTTPVQVPPKLSVEPTDDVLARFNQEQRKINSMSNVMRDLATFEMSDFWSAVDTLYSNSLINNIRDYAQQAITYSESNYNIENNLTIDECASIFLYTMEWSMGREESFYFVVNKHLRDNTRQLKYFYPFIKLIVSGLQKLKPFVGTVWRGFNGVSNVSSLYKKGEVVCWNAFTSCSTDVSAFGNNFFADNKGENTLFNIQVCTGYSISPYSSFPLENEILLLPGEKFKVVDVLTCSESLVIVQLQQLHK